MYCGLILTASTTTHSVVPSRKCQLYFLGQYTCLYINPVCIFVRSTVAMSQQKSITPFMTTVPASAMMYDQPYYS